MKYYTKNLPINVNKYYIIAILFLFTSIILGIIFGSTKLSVIDIINILFKENENNIKTNILIYVRLPRVLGSLFCGASLAVSGCIIQNVLFNKLASPSVIGVNAGAGFAVALCSAIGFIGGWQISLFAFLGAFVTVFLVSLASKKWDASSGTVILLGIAINSLLGAFTDMITTFNPDISIINNDFKIGDFSAVTYSKIIPSVIIIIFSFLIILMLSKELDVLSLGDDNAKGLGLNINITRILFLILASLLAGAAVSICGLLSFVGLLVPHAVRRKCTTENKHLIPLCALFGGGFVTLCDTISRVLFSPYELPVGILMAFLGAPFFIYILIKRKGEHNYD